MYICENCGKEFTEKYSQYTDGRFCCRSCARSYTSKQSRKTKICKCTVCGCDVEVNCHTSDKFVICEKCREEINHKEQQLKKLRARKRNEYRNRQIRLSQDSDNYCLNCGKEIPYGQKFCSNKCVNEHKHKMTFQQIKDNNGVGCYIRQIKAYLIETRGHKCEICGNTEWRGEPIPLIIDHINGRASDNRLENLRLVCGNCDMQLPTYKSKNKHSDRSWRKKYYVK